jgi:hypothetical protein
MIFLSLYRKMMGYYLKVGILSGVEKNLLLLPGIETQPSSP